MVDLNIEEQKILDYLENSYTGARTMNDETTPTALFTPKFIDNYCL